MPLVGPWLPLLILCCALCGCSNLTPFSWTYTPGQGWSGPQYQEDDSDANWMADRTKQYEKQGQGPRTAHDNAYYDFVNETGAFPNP